MAETDTGANIPAEDSVQEPPAGKRKKSRAGRNLPAAIAVGAAIGFSIIAILIWDRYLWVFLLTAAMPLATHEVVRRLREADYVIPVIPLLAGGELMVWLAWYYHAVGALAGFGITAVVCMFWRLALGASSAPDGSADSPSGNYLRDVAATVFVAAWVPLFASFSVLLAYPPTGSGAGVLPDDRRRRLRRRRLCGRRAVRQAPDGPVDQPEQVVGGPGRFADLRDHRGHVDRNPSDPQAGVDRPAARA